MATITHEELHARLSECNIPSHTHEGIVRYILQGRPCGPFLNAIYSNDLKEACNRADEENRYRLYDYIFFLYNYAPAACFGSPEKFQAWIQGGGFKGIYQKEAANGTDQTDRR